MQTLLASYFPVLIFIGLALVFSLVPVAAGMILGPRKPDPAKNSAYECGFDAFDNARMPFDLRFYLIAILFVIFDVETAFLFPWAVVLRQIGWFGLAAMGLFLGLLVVGFIFEWRKGALEWE